MAASPALSRLMDQAESAAAADTSAGTALATRSTGSAVATTSGSRPSLDSMMDSSGISVDQYLQLKHEGFKLSNPEGLFDSDIIASIDMNQIVPIVQVRVNNNGQTTFYKSYDGETTNDGQNLQMLVERLKATPGNVVTGPYQTSEIPFELLEPITVGGKSGGTVPAGTMIGTTPPITGVKYLSAFLKSLREKGLMAETVKVRIVHLPQKNNKGNSWGVCDFKFVEVLGPDSE